VGHHVTRKVSLEETYGECHGLVGATEGVGNRELCNGELHRSTAVTRSTTQVAPGSHHRHTPGSSKIGY
jgi:hypothetical protein